MDIRVLRYFLAVAREQSYSVAAERLYLSQPTLSRQLKELEEELGTTLLIRSNKGVTLTEEGMILRKRAEEIVELMEKTELEVRQSSEQVSGKVYIGAGETYSIKLIADTAQKLQCEHPDIRYSIYSADGTDVLERLDRGLIDFGMIFQPYDSSKYEGIEIPLKDTFGVLMRKDMPLADKDVIELSDLIGKPLIIPRQPNHNTRIAEMIGKYDENMHIAAEYNLVYNGSVMAAEGMGYCVTFDKLINVSGDSKLCFKPLLPKFEATCTFVWKKYTVFTKAAELFLRQFRQDIEELKNNTEKG
ncbi:MAG: LysR family transcriptional regulator [Ruminococcus sp.]|uniref:LysR family transcriptional regulator n=1 Tax=Ruminococcus sp. TaxID=41978 RepID=UPI0025D69699|nr:LysR family transcriptional regulator [Ruminococcus sp.]MBR0528902.1 LysR family transcriptional regulator [Ruminococcus sp.]